MRGECVQALGLKSQAHVFSQEKHDCADASSGKGSPEREPRSQGIAEVGKVTFEAGGGTFQHKTFKLDLHAFSFSNECVL